MSKRPEEYYPKINNLIKVLSKNIKNCATEEPFDRIRNTRNPDRYLQKIIKKYKNKEKRAMDGKLPNLLGRGRKAIGDSNAKTLKTKIIFKIREYLDDSQRKKLLSKYLTLWKANCRKKGLDINFARGIEKLTEIIISFFRFLVLYKL